MIESSQICSGEKFQQLCDVYCGVPWHLDRNPIISSQKDKHLNLETLSQIYDNPSLIFCYSCSLELLMQKIHLFKNKFILVSHNEDENVTEKYIPLADNPKIIKWFAQNLIINHYKVEFLPIGIANSMWPHGNINKLADICNMAENIEKTNNFLFNFSTSTNEKARTHCRNILESKGLKFTSNIPREMYLQTLATYKFVICPEGNGIDSHRIWEALYLNVIPILVKNNFSLNLQKNIPCIVLDKWEDFDPDFALKYYDLLIQHLNQRKKYLYFDTYKNNIINQVKLLKDNNNELNLAYVFIGNLPEYALHTVYQSRLFYNGPIYFIINDYSNPIVDILRNKFNVTIIKYHDVYDEDFENLINCMNYRFQIVTTLKGREKIFIYSFERFFVLANLMKINNLKNVLFLELDNLIYDNPVKWLPKLSEKDMAFMYDNHERFASGISYIKSYEFLKVFLEHCVDFISNSRLFLCEMTALSTFYPKYKSNIQLLPIHWSDTNLPSETYQSFELYKDSIFDAAAIGIYIGGLDPFHTKGEIVKNQKSEWSYIDYTKYKFKWEYDSDNRNIPYIFDGHNWLRINNLHIHSKDLKSNLSKYFML